MRNKFFKKNIYYFNIFSNKKYFEKQYIPHSHVSTHIFILKLCKITRNCDRGFIIYPLYIAFSSFIYIYIYIKTIEMFVIYNILKCTRKYTIDI